MGEHQCRCDLCVKWMPLFDRIKERLDETDRALFDDWINKCAVDSMDAGYYQACLNGDWKGWEWMKDVLAERGYVQRPGNDVPEKCALSSV